MFFRTHPGYDQLSRLADGELAAAEAMEVNGHLAQCERCREEVDFMAELRERLRELAVPGPPSSLLPEILDRRAAGERRVLPLALEPPPALGSRTRKGAAALVALVALGAAGFFAFGPQSIRAGASSFELETRGAGRPVSVTLNTTGLLAGESILRVRAEYFTRGEQEFGDTGAGTVVEGDLRRRRQGQFRGEVLLPSTVAYARFAVEDYRGEDIDRDYGESWEYLEENVHGHPTFDALWQRTLALEEAAPREALRSARELTERYPDRPEGWIFRLAKEGGLPGVPSAPPVRAFLQRLPASPHPDELARIADYADRMGAREVKALLLDRIEANDPRHPAVVERRVTRLFEDLGSNQHQLLSALEAEWLSHGHPDELLLQLGLGVALGLGDAQAALHWADRWVAADPEAGAKVVASLAELPDLRPAAAARLRVELARLDRPSIRELGVSRSEQQIRRDRRRAGVLGALGRVLASEGALEAAADTLARAIANWWDPDTVERMVTLSDALGHESAADRYRVLLAADPLLDEERRVRVENAIDLEPGTRARRLIEARREMVDGILGSDRDRIYPEGPIRVASIDGGPRDLAARLGHAPTLVQFWSPLLPTSLEKLESLLTRCDRLAAAGVRLIAVSVDDVDQAQLPEGHDTCPAFEILIDATREAQLSFRTHALAEGVLVDRGGQVRARFLDGEDSIRAALALAAID